MLIENLEDLNKLIKPYINDGSNCILSISDNKSNINLQHIVVKHPLEFIRNLNDFSKNIRLPVSDMDIHLIGYISSTNFLLQEEEKVLISPYVYFKRPEEVSVSVSDVSTSVES